MQDQPNLYAKELNFIKAALQDYVNLMNERPSISYALSEQSNLAIEKITEALGNYSKQLIEEGKSNG